MKRQGKKESVWMFFWSAASKIIAYLLLLVFGNWYIVSEYGKAVFLLAIYNILTMISTIGIPNAIVPWIIKKKDYKPIFRFLFFVSIAVAIISLFITYLMIDIKNYNKELIYPAIFIALAIPIYWANNVSAAFIISKKRYDFVHFVGAISILLTLVLAVLLKALGGFGIIISYFAGYVLSAIILIGKTKKEFFSVWKKTGIKMTLLKLYLKEGVVIALVALSFHFLGWVDSTILGILSNLENVGRYNISSAFANIAILIPVALSMFVLTRMAEIKEIKPAKKILKRVIRVSYFFTLIIGILVSSYVFVVIKIFFPRYIGIEKYISILLIGSAFYSVYFLVYSYFIAKSNARKSFLPIVMAAGINIILDIILIPYFGIAGICAATAIAHFVPFVLLAKKIYKGKEIITISLLSLTIFAAHYLMYFGIIIAIAAVILSLKIKLIEKEDLRIVKKEIKEVVSRKF